MRSLLFLWWWCGVGVLCYVCIMLLWSLYQNCSRFASTFFAFFFNLYTLPLLYKNRRDFGLFLFAFYTKDELFYLIAFLPLIIPFTSTISIRSCRWSLVDGARRWPAWYRFHSLQACACVWPAGLIGSRCGISCAGGGCVCW